MAKQEIDGRVRTYLDPLPRQEDRLAVVTGANGALGAQLTRFLVDKGAAVIMACRNLETGERVRNEILARQPQARLTLMALDLGSLSSVHSFAQEFERHYNRLDLLFANAGVMAVKRRLTQDGFESQLGINHLGHFALTGRLLPQLLAAPGARIVSTTSSAAYAGWIDFRDPMGERRYNRWLAYCQSKLANILFSNALQRRLAASASNGTAHSAHPGLVHTDLQTRAAGASRSRFERLLLNRVVPVLGQGTAMGALPLLHAGLSPQARGGDLWAPRWRFLRGRPIVGRAPDPALDRDKQERLWRLSLKLTGVSYPGLSEPSH